MTQRAIDGQFIYFVTTTTADRVWYFESLETTYLLTRNIHEACRTYGFTLFAFCIMPDHLHLLVQKNNAVTLSVLMKTIKGRFSFSMRRGRLWQPRSHFRIIDQEDYFWNVISYIKYNFQKHALHERFSRYPYVYIINGQALHNLTAQV
jgi:putative transposase